MLLLKSFITLITLLMLLGCEDPSQPEHMITDNITRLEEGIENKDADQVLDLLHDNFGTQSGDDKLWVKRVLALYMLKYNNIEIVTSNMTVEINSDNATANFSVLVTGGEGLLPEQGALYKVEMDWRIQDKKWLLIYTNWSQL